MPKCFIRTSRNYSGRLSQEIDDGSRNQHRTVTRSGRRYIKPALPLMDRHRRLGAPRCRDRLEDTSYSPRSILQTSPKFKYRQKCNPWHQVSVVTRFYLGRQFPQLDVTGLKPHERPVWPQDFPCSWSSPDEDDYLMRSDQACSPSSDLGDTDQDITTDTATEIKKAPDNRPHFCSLRQASAMSEPNASDIEKLTALRLRPEKPVSSNSFVLGPFRLGVQSTKDLKLAQIRSLTGLEGRLLAKVFTIKSQTQTGTVSHQLSGQNSGVMGIQLPVSVKRGLTSSGATHSSFTATRSKMIIKGENSVWTKPIKFETASPTNLGKVDKIERRAEISDQSIPNQKLTASKPRLESPSSAFKACNDECDSNQSIPTIKIISSDKLGIKDRHYKCSDCGRVFTVLTALTSHMRTHTRQRNKCDECGKVFTRSWLLKGHMRTHTGERPFLCPEPGCDKAFADKSNLRSHLLIHTVTTKSFVCQKCGRAFAQKRYLHKHMLEVCRMAPEGV
ncbi:zinc finger protein 354B-like [Liolophura sinensis]|uniref:zinc finger protein 354B-like n=1 Tax=Liolophura sinensis TaxID=3198878 RepID=UPI0031596D24